MATHCPSCKAPIRSATARNCEHCGVVLPPTAPAAAKPAPAQGSFFRDNWVWFVAPLVFAIVIVLLVVFVFGGGDDTSPFIYSIF